MALPEHVAPDELIESTWGNAVVDNLTRLTEADADAAVTIPGNVDAGAAALTDWLVVGIAVPAWATRARIVTTVAGLHQIGGAAGDVFEMQTRLGVAGGRIAFHTPNAVGSRQTVAWNDALAVSSTGALSIAVLARRVFGTGVLRVDVSSSCLFTVRFDW